MMPKSARVIGWLCFTAAVCVSCGSSNSSLGAEAGPLALWHLPDSSVTFTSGPAIEGVVRITDTCVTFTSTPGDEAVTMSLPEGSFFDPATNSVTYVDMFDRDLHVTVQDLDQVVVALNTRASGGIAVPADESCPPTRYAYGLRHK